jgi:hypothetical protein
MDLILGSCVAYPPGRVRPFLESLRRHYAGNVVFLTADLPAETTEMLRHFRVTIVPVKIPPPAARIQRLRFFAYERIVKSNPGVARVLVTDVADVFFQGDPFPMLPEAPLTVFLEDNTIGACHYNAGWVRDAYGATRLDELADLPVSCSGTVAGDRAGVLRYLEAMCRELRAYRGQNPAGDQGHHNHLVHGELAGIATLVENRAGAVQTLHHQKRFEFDRVGRLINRDGSVCPVIHQFNRHPVFFPLLGINPSEYQAA